MSEAPLVRRAAKRTSAWGATRRTSRAASAIRTHTVATWSGTASALVKPTHVEPRAEAAEALVGRAAPAEVLEAPAEVLAELADPASVVRLFPPPVEPAFVRAATKNSPSAWGISAALPSSTASRRRAVPVSLAIPPGFAGRSSIRLAGFRAHRCRTLWSWGAAPTVAVARANEPACSRVSE